MPDLQHPNMPAERPFPEPAAPPELSVAEDIFAYKGLTSAEVQERVARDAVNTAVASASKSTREIILSNLLTYYNLIFAILAVLLILVGSFRDLTFLGIVVANTLIGIVQEMRAKKALDKLQLVSEPRATAIRDGSPKRVPVEDLVLDDLVQLGAGAQIPADAVVCTGSVNVNEALLTGEADEITKSPGDELLSGSFIVSGTCTARLTRVGRESYVSQLTLQATQSKRGEQSEMIRALNRLVQVVGIVIIPIGVVLFLQQYLTGTPFRESVVAMVAAVLGMIPEGLYLLASVALVVSVMRLAKNQVLIHDMKCIEALARVDVLCVDKTGTITQNEMQVEQVVPVGDHDPAQVDRLICALVQNMSSDNATMAALQKYFTEPSPVRVTQTCPFSSEFKYSGVQTTRSSYVIGAPEFVLRAQAEQFRDQLTVFSEQGRRVLAFAEYGGKLDGKQLTAEVTPLAFVLLSNPIRPEAPATFAYFADNGVEVKVISGDNPVTVSSVAQQAGIAHADQYVDASTLQTPAELAEAVQNYTVFGRVTPAQKKEMVLALKKQGRTVGMTGDGVNDVLALKEADCSVAMASGSDAASQIAQLVLLESDFSKMPSVVKEGRRVVNNIERSASLFLVKNIFSFLLAIFSLASFFSYPLRPAQVSLISMFTIGIPSFLLALEPNHARISGRFLPNVLRKALPAGITNFLCAAALVLYGNATRLEGDQLSTICALLIAFVGFMVLRRIAAPFNWVRGVVFVLLAGGCIGSAIWLKGLFAIEPLPFGQLLLLMFMCLSAITVFRWMNVGTERVWDLASARRAQAGERKQLRQRQKVKSRAQKQRSKRARAEKHAK